MIKTLSILLADLKLIKPIRSSRKQSFILCYKKIHELDSIQLKGMVLLENIYMNF